MTRSKKLFASLAVIAALTFVGAAAYASHGAFTDVPTYHPHAVGITAAHGKGLFEGYPDGSFKPDKALTNKQAAAVLARLIERYNDEEGNTTLSRGGAATLLAYGVCGIESCSRATPFSYEEIIARQRCHADAVAMRYDHQAQINDLVFGEGDWAAARRLERVLQAEYNSLKARCPSLTVQR